MTAPKRELTPLHLGPPVEAGCLSAWRIVQLAVLKGEFRASWRYRDALLRRRCAKLRRQGWLRQVRAPGGEDLYVPTVEAISFWMEEK